MDIVLMSEIAGIISSIVLIITIFTRKTPHNLLELNLDENFKTLVWLTFFGWLMVIIIAGNIMSNYDDSIFNFNFEPWGTLFTIFMLVVPFWLFYSIFDKDKDKPLLKFILFLIVSPIIMYILGDKPANLNLIYGFLYLTPSIAFGASIWNINQMNH